MSHIMNLRKSLRRLAWAVAAALVLPIATATAAFAQEVPPPSGFAGTRAHLASNVTPTVVTGGMPGWEIAVIAVGAALVAAVIAVLADRARAARRLRVTVAH